tara:strand:+ start:1516 stop:2751 length:1236 start_codon:yes stop_codon:yes gene_type:complete
LSFEHFLSKKILSARAYKNSISAPIIKIGVSAIAISVIVMIISVGIGTGMQKEIKDKISAFEGHITIQKKSFNSIEQNSLSPISPDQKVLDILTNIADIKSVENIISRFGIVRTDQDFDGLFFKGVEIDYDFEKIQPYLISGSLPSFSEDFSDEVLISKSLANKLNLNIDDNFQMLFSKENNNSPSILKLKIKGIFDSGFEELDSKFLIGDIRHMRRILKWAYNDIGYLEIQLYDHTKSEDVSNYIYQNTPPDYDVISTNQKYKSIYEWIELFDKNIYAIIFIMVLVASINIISVLLVLILERTNMIGILKAIGATNMSIQKFFIIVSSYLIFLGISIGNILGLMILFIQKNFNIIPLDPKIYYVSSVPVNIDFFQISVLNIIVFTLCVFSILLPSLVVSRVTPKDSIKFN